MSATNHMIRKKRPASDNWKKPHVHRPLSSWQGFNHIDICWRDSTGEHKQFRKILECIHGNLLTQVVGEQKRGYAVPGLTLTNKQELVGDVKVRGQALAAVTMG